MRPHSIPVAEAMNLQKTLGGFHECKASFPLMEAEGEEEEGGIAKILPHKVLQSANLSWLSSTETWTEDGVALFSALLPKDKKKASTSATAAVAGSDRVIVQVSLETGSCQEKKVVLQVNADDAMLSASLLDVLKRGIASPHPVRTV